MRINSGYLKPVKNECSVGEHSSDNLPAEATQDKQARRFADSGYLKPTKNIFPYDQHTTSYPTAEAPENQGWGPTLRHVASGYLSMDSHLNPVN